MRDMLDKQPPYVLYFLLVVFMRSKAMTKRSTHIPLPERAAACMRWKAASRQDVIYLRMEILFVKPLLIQSVFYAAGVIGLG